MSIDAQVQSVFFHENGGGRLNIVDRPIKRKGDYPGCAGQPRLYFDYAPEEVSALNGLEVWGGESELMLGDVEIAKRAGYETIVFHSREVFIRAVKAYHQKRIDDLR